MVGALALALIGAVLVFALSDDDASVIGLELQPLGGVLLVLGLLVLIGTAIAASSDGAGSGTDCRTSTSASVIRTMGGLIAVISGTLVVGGLAAFTMTRLGSDESESAVAIASSAFGVISAVIGAYLGIKISADQSIEAKGAAVAEEQAEAAKEQLADARQQADVVKQKLSGLRSQLVDELPQEQADKIMGAGVRASEREPPPQTPPKGGGAA